MQKIEIWADSFHEGNWCCDCLSSIAKEKGYSVVKSYFNGFQPKYLISKNDLQIELLVYGSYKSWDPIPKKVADLIDWGKPDFVAYDASKEEILFAVEETAATPTGNQAEQRCERQYGGARAKIPYWYLISEYSIKASDGGIRRDSIWPSIAAIKLSIYFKSPCVVLHYSDIDNPEDYNSGGGVNLLFASLFKILINHSLNLYNLNETEDILTKQYIKMFDFVLSQWKNIIDFLPSKDKLEDANTAKYIAEVVTGNLKHITLIEDLLKWPKIKNVPTNAKQKWKKSGLIKYDVLCEKMENDIELGKAYYLSNNAGSGKPQKETQLAQWIKQQKQLLNKETKISPPIKYQLTTNDFPDTGNGNKHITTAKNIVYLYDSWNCFVDTVVSAYPRLNKKLDKLKNDVPVFVYVSNSLKPGRLFGDPYTGQLAAYSTAFGKFDKNGRKVVAYFPHQVHTQAILNGQTPKNKGITLMTELTDYIIFYGGVLINLAKREVK